MIFLYKSLKCILSQKDDKKVISIFVSALTLFNKKVMEMQPLENLEHKSHQKLHSTDSRRNLNMQSLENLNAESGTQQELELAGSLMPNEGSVENQASDNCITLIK